ncbi:MAG: hypothetical protein GKS02_13345 [Alphaproteobacteria bacterium]|nr:hypothetical protein [Alphaproteobacteria bacterium]
MVSTKFSLSRLLGAALFALALALPLQGASAANKLDVLNKGPRVGDPIPHQLTIADQNNEIRDFAGLKRKKGLILLFSRSFDW